jgi:fructose-specific phosphotransferase system IIA component
MNLYSLLEKSAILSEVEAESKEELLHALIDSLENQVSKEQLDDARNAVFQREKIMSTGVGKQLAIPHGKVASIDRNIAAFAILKEPIEFNSIDNEPVKMVFLLIGPEKSNSAHIKLLSRISRLMNSGSFRETLSECVGEDQIYDAFYNEEIRYFGQ